MHILLITQLPPPKGGIATWSQGYLEHMGKTFHRIDVVNTAAIGGRSQDVNASKSLGTELKRALQIWNKTREKMRTRDFDVVHINVVGTVTGMVRDLVTLQLLGKHLPKVVQFHSNLSDQVGDSRLGQFLLKKITAGADTVLVLNSPTARYLKQVTGIEPICVSNFIDGSYVRTDPREISPRIQSVVFTGHIVPGKGIAEILEAAVKFPQIRFSLLGKQPEETQLPACPQNVELCGEKSPEEVQSALDCADIFLFPSYSEGFSVSLTEAMARGLPVIASDVGANRDMLEDRGGILVPPRNASEICTAMGALQDSALRRSMSDWNLQKVSSCYTADAVFAQLLDLYERTIEKRG